MKVSIYTLDDPITGEPRYVGKTIQGLEERLIQHISKSYTRTSHVNCWIRGLLQKGLEPDITELDEVEEDKWVQEEQFYISYLRYLGFKLTNNTIGGEAGTLGATWKLSPDKIPHRVINPFFQFTMDGKFIKQWDTYVEYARSFNVHINTVPKLVKRNYHNNSILVYKIDYNGKIPTPKIPIRNNPVICTNIVTGKEVEYKDTIEASMGTGFNNSSISKQIKSGKVNSYNLKFRNKFV